MIHGKHVTINGSTFYRVTKADPCEVCDHPDWCRRFEDGYTECMRVENGRPTRSGGWLHWTGSGVESSGDWRERIAIIPSATVEEQAPIDPELCDRVYRFVLGRCPLSDDHRCQFHDRGFSDALIATGHYGSLTEATRDVVAAAAVDAFGESIIGAVPGFSRKKDGSPSLFAHTGILIPVVDDLGHIYRLRVRPDDETKQAEGKYRHVSSPECGSGANLHVARPLAGNCQVDRIGLTEGEIKANYAANHLGMTIISRPGIGVNADVPAMLERLGVKEVDIFDDMDGNSNPAVAAHEGRLVEVLVSLGYVVRRATWPEQFKGIDDCLVAGVMPMLEARPLIAPCAEALAEKDQVIADLKQRLVDLSELHTAYVAANHAPHLGQERSTAAALVVDLSTVPVGEWKAMPHKRIAEQAGISERAVPRQLKTVKPVIADVVEIKTEWIPRRADPESGAVTGGKNMTFARLKTDRVTALRTIASGMPEKGHKNGHGGKRLPCPECGDVGVVRKWTDYCAGCGQSLDEGESRIKPGNCQVVSLDTATDPDLNETAAPDGDRQVVMVPYDVPMDTVLSATVLAVSHNDDPEWLSTAPDLARMALNDADHVTDRTEKHRVHADLDQKLGVIPRHHGKTPVPKPEPAKRTYDRLLFSCRSDEAQAQILAGQGGQS